MNISLAKKLTLLVALPTLISCQGDDRQARSDKEAPGAIPGISTQVQVDPPQSDASGQPGNTGTSEMPDTFPNTSPSTDTSVDDPDNSAGDDCGEHVFAAKALPPNVMLVLDKSGSMYFQSWVDGGVSKRRWASLHAVTETLLRRLDGRFNFGLKLFPALGAQESENKAIACRLETGVEVECGPNQADKILSVMPGAQAEVYGDTPTVSGLNAAYEYLSGLSTKNPKAVVLIVDGETNCNETNQGLSNLAQQAHQAKIPVYVVGIDLKGPVATALAQVAVAGGTKKLYNTQDSDALISTLESILGEVVSCTIPFTTAPQYPDRVEVQGPDKTVIPQLIGATSCAQAAAEGKSQGWLYPKPGPAPKEIQLCGSSCDAFRKDPQLKVEFHCPPPV